MKFFEDEYRKNGVEPVVSISWASCTASPQAIYFSIVAVWPRTITDVIRSLPAKYRTHTACHICALRTVSAFVVTVRCTVETDWLSAVFTWLLSGLLQA